MTFSDDFLKAFGRMSINFQTLEWHMALLTWMMISSDPNVGQIVTSQISFNGLSDLLSKLFKYRTNDKVLIGKLEDILRRASNVRQQRNTLVHSDWYEDGTGTALSFNRKFTIMSKRKGVNIQMENMNAKELDKIADSIESLAKELMDFIVELHAPKNKAVFPE